MSSRKALDGTRTCWSAAKTEVPGRSRTANRYESVATRRSPSPSAAINTPVRIGRLSSTLAADTTCRSASANAAASSSTVCSAGSGNCGNSWAGIVRTENCDRPELMRASSSVSSTSTAFGSSARTMSVTNFAGRTPTPSEPPDTVVDTAIVRSRSLPVNRRSLPANSRRTPDNTGRAPPRLVTARPAAPSASTRTSRSQRNFTFGSLSTSMSLKDLKGSSCSRSCGLWTMDPFRWSPPRFLFLRHPQRCTGSQVFGWGRGMKAPSSTGGPPVMDTLSTGLSTGREVTNRSGWLGSTP